MSKFNNRDDDCIRYLGGDLLCFGSSTKWPVEELQRELTSSSASIQKLYGCSLDFDYFAEQQDHLGLMYASLLHILWCNTILH